MKNAYNFSKDHEERPDFKNRQFIWWKNTYFALWYSVSSLQFSSVTQSCLTLCNPMDHSMPGHPVHHHSWSLLKLMSIELVMPSNHLTFCHPLFLLPLIFASNRIFSNELVSCIRWPNIGVSALASVLPFNIQDWFPLGWTSWVSWSPRDSQESFPTRQFKSINSLALSFLYSPNPTSIHDYWKKHRLD